MPRLTLIIDKNGNSKVTDVTGFGSSCVDATANFERKLGAANESGREYTAEFTKKEETRVDIDAQSGG